MIPDYFLTGVRLRRGTQGYTSDSCRIPGKRRISLYYQAGGLCYYCRQRTYLDIDVNNPLPDDATVDHFIPKSKGGSSRMENLVLACRDCNGRKGDGLPFIPLDQLEYHASQREMTMR